MLQPDEIQPAVEEYWCVCVCVGREKCNTGSLQRLHCHEHDSVQHLHCAYVCVFSECSVQ